MSLQACLVEIQLLCPPASIVVWIQPSAKGFRNSRPAPFCFIPRLVPRNQLLLFSSRNIFNSESCRMSAAFSLSLFFPVALPSGKVALWMTSLTSPSSPPPLLHATSLPPPPPPTARLSHPTFSPKPRFVSLAVLFVYAALLGDS